MDVDVVGAYAFGLVVGWITYRTLRRSEGTSVSDLAAVIAAVGGGAVTALSSAGELFGHYAIGLALGFFLYLAVATKVDGIEGSSEWMGRRRQPNGDLLRR